MLKNIISSFNFEKGLSIFAAIVSFLSLLISFYNARVLNKSKMTVQLDVHSITPRDSKYLIYGDVIVVNLTRREKYTKEIVFETKSLTTTICDTCIKIASEGQLKIPFQIMIGPQRETGCVRIWVFDTLGKKWSSPFYLLRN